MEQQPEIKIIIPAETKDNSFFFDSPLSPRRNLPALQSARGKIKKLKDLGYTMLGHLPSYDEIPSVHRQPNLIRFLFKRKGEYFQITYTELLTLNKPLPVDTNGNPTGESFRKIETESFIYFSAEEFNPDTNEKNCVTLFKEAAKGGHAVIAGTYGKNCGFMSLIKPLAEYSDEILITELKASRCYPKSSFVWADGRLSYIMMNKGTLHRRNFNLSKAAVAELMTELELTPEILTAKDINFLAPELITAKLKKIILATQFLPFFLRLGGEFHFYKGKLILANNKSGGFPSDCDSTKRWFSECLDPEFLAEFLEAYFPAFEEPEVNAELEKRKTILDAQPSTAPATANLAVVAVAERLSQLGI